MTTQLGAHKVVERSSLSVSKAQSTIATAAKELSEEQQLGLYRQMLRMRRFEEVALQQYQRGAIGGFCHLYIGQEAVAAGALSALEKGDRVLTGYRDHAHAIMLGMAAESLMAELFGKATGCSKGKGGSMHFFDRERGMFGGNGIVGSHVAVSVGVAFAQKYAQDKQATLVFFGEGAAQQGAVHEAMNLAGLWRLPLVFILENNRYGMGTSVERSSATQELYKRASGYGFKGFTCDGMDVLDVHAQIGEALKRARYDFEPALIEAKTYRYRGHSMSDPALYRTLEEVEQYKHQDPVLRLKSVLLKRGVSELKLEELDRAAKAEMRKSVEFAASSPEPELKELATDVYAQPWSDDLLPRVKLD